MLALEVILLLGRYAATDHRDRGRAEWPPHPGRLFSALVAAAARLPDPAPARAALRWLEALPPPHLRADPDPAVQSVETAFVPVNDPAGPPLPGRPDRQPRTFPSVVPSDPAVAFVWPDADPAPETTAALDAVVRAVTYLGSSRSPALARLLPDPPSRTSYRTRTGTWSCGSRRRADWTTWSGTSGRGSARPPGRPTPTGSPDPRRPRARRSGRSGSCSPTAWPARSGWRPRPRCG